MLLSVCEVSQCQISRPFWYGKCSTQSGLVVAKPKLYGPVLRVLSYETYWRFSAM